MGERRKRKSFWDIEEETKHLSGMSEPNSWTGKERHSNYDDGRYHGFSASGNTSVPKSTDDSEWASWETTEQNPTALMSDSFVKRRQDAPEVKDIGGVNRYYKNMSPGFDGMERRNYNNTFEADRSHSRRYPVRGRSRSRSRSRGRTSGRSRSRSLSGGRGRERDRGRGWSRSRSRSRSRSNGSGRGRTRSRSPVGDYRRQSYGWNDRTRGPDKSSQSCRNFVAGSCRRGSQCRFLHPNNVSHRDGDHLEDEPAESWRNRADRSHISKHASYSRGTGFEMQDDVSDPYHGKDEQFTTKGRNAFPCKDFMRGNCRWADTCKFSHHIASGDSSGKGTRVGSFDKGTVRQSNQYGKPICKFFAAGKCDRDNCRFSHEDSKLSDTEGRRTEVIDHRSLRDKSNWLDDAPRVLDSVNPVGWSDTLVPNMNSTGGTISGKGEDRWGHSMENESKTWGIPEWKENSLKREKQLSPLEDNGSHDRHIGTTEFIGKDHMANKQELVILHGSQLQNEDGILDVQQQNAMQEDSFSIKALQQNVSSASHIQQQQHGVVGNNLVNQFGSDVLDGVKDSRNTTHPTFFSRQNLNQNGEITFVGHSLISNEIDGVQNMLRPMPSNEIIADLNGPKRDIAAHLNLQAQMQNHQKAVESPEMLESKVLHFFPNLLTTENSAQVTNSPVAIRGQQVAPVTENPTVFLSQRFLNEQSQIYPGVELSSSRGMMPSFSEISSHTPPVNTENAQLNSATGSLDLFNPLENGRDTSEHVNHYLPPGTEQNSHMNVRQSSPLYVGEKSENSKMKHPESPKPKQEEVLPNSEDEVLGEERKDVKKNMQSETLDGHGKVEEGSAQKDEKGMRTFKNALIEFVKEILKPTWKEGHMSREVHKTVVKKVVDKVTSTIQVDHIPKTQDKVEHYLSYSKPKITKLVQAYVERCSKTDS